MKHTQQKIISPTWVWLWYYDEYKTKHFKELIGEEAEEWIKENKSAKK